MTELNLSDVQSHVSSHIREFHQAKLAVLDQLNFKDILGRKNPYLFRAKNMLTSGQIVSSCIEDHISLIEEALFDDWLKELALFVNSKVYGGWKSRLASIDLEFDEAGIHNIVAIRSWSNGEEPSQLAKMKEEFAAARHSLLASNSRLQINAINGCCYGRDRNPDKGDYFKYCGQSFWQLISGNEDLYLNIIEPLGFEAKKNNDEYMELLAQVINQFTREFSDSFCKENGKIAWDKLVKFNSGKTAT